MARAKLETWKKDFAKFGPYIEALLKDREKLPRKAGNELVRFFKHYYRQGGYLQNGFHSWKMTQRQLYGSLYGKGAASKYLPLHSKRMHLWSCIRAIPYNGKVHVYNNVRYADIQNDGGTTHPKVTKKMRGYFWYMYYQTLGIKKGVKRKKKPASNPLAEKYKAIALTKKTSLTVKIPQRKFIYDSPEVGKAVQKLVKEEIIKAIKRRK